MNDLHTNKKKIEIGFINSKGSYNITFVYIDSNRRKCEL